MVIAIMTSVGAPQGIGRIAKVEEMLTDIGTDMGVPSRYIVTEAERKDMDEKEAQAAAAAAAAAAALSAGGAAGGMPA